MPYGDWLGTGLLANHQLDVMPFREACAFVSGLKLRNKADWQAYCRGESSELPPKPQSIPASPDKVYSPDEFSWRAWFGKSAPRALRPRENKDPSPAR